MGFLMKYCLIVVAFVFVGCGFDFQEVHEVKGLRVLAVSADPPEIAPGEGTSIDVLWADPEGDGRTIEFVWWFCAGYAYGAHFDACELLGSPYKTNSDEGGDHFETPDVPPNIFDMVELPEEMDALMVSAVGLICADGKLPSIEKLSKPKEVKHINEFCKGGEAVSFLRTIDISESDNPQRNPGIDRVTYKKEPLTPLADDPDGRTVRCKQKEGCDLTVELKLFMTEGSEQGYEVTEYGEIKKETEVLFVSWFTTNGDFDDGVRSLVEDDAKSSLGPFEIGWEPDEPGHHVVYAVAHDIRGGVSFQAYAFEVLPAK